MSSGIPSSKRDDASATERIRVLGEPRQAASAPFVPRGPFPAPGGTCVATRSERRSADAATQLLRAAESLARRRRREKLAPAARRWPLLCTSGRMLRSSFGLLVLLGACALPPIQYRAQKEARWEGTAAPELAGELITGEGPRSLAEAKGRVVIVEFWATFCDPCERSFPKYQQLADRFGDSVAVIAISLDEQADVKRGALQQFAQRTGAKFPLLWDQDGAMKRAYAPPSLPTSYVIDQSGAIVHVHVKYESGDADVIAREVEDLLARAQAKPNSAELPSSPPAP